MGQTDALDSALAKALDLATARGDLASMKRILAQLERRQRTHERIAGVSHIEDARAKRGR